ncbi:GatB/YqeY domain-containing protein [Nonomuraea sp. NPDC050022]|uniref:GatB/YqeY domain-containing protein n=1 Tax=unclassified Nonomuraea TaxID=2593643 RepID=UPI0033DD6AAF
MRANLRDDLKTALKARDRIAITALRSALAAIENAEAVPVDSPSPGGPEYNEHFAGSTAGLGTADVERRLLTEADLLSILEKEVRERSVAAQEYERLGRDDHAERLRAEAEVLSRYLEPTV